MLDLGADMGALVVYTDASLHGTEIELGPSGRDARRHKQVHVRASGTGRLYAAVFDRVPAGRHTLSLDGAPHELGVEVEAGCVTELDWRAEARAHGNQTRRREQ